MIDLSASTQVPAQGSDTIPGAGKVVEVRWDSRFGRVTIQLITNNGKMSFDPALVDGGDLGAAEYFTVFADGPNNLVTIRRRPQAPNQVVSVFINAANGTRIEAIGEIE